MSTVIIVLMKPQFSAFLFSRVFLSCSWLLIRQNDSEFQVRNESANDAVAYSIHQNVSVCVYFAVVFSRGF